ncbi:MAG TPA: cytochrome c [Castellaniella sp.]|nr:cytochrome c [Castellaniella sp.]
MDRVSRRIIHAGLALCAAAGALYGLACLNAEAAPESGGPADFTDPDLVSRGAYIARLGDCAGCHTDTRPGSPPFAGGQAMNSPFGTIYVSNITPDPETGIGRYRYADFERAVRQGVAPGGKRLYPAMPYPSFTKISDADLRALYAYFMHGVAPVKHRPPRTDLPFPFDQRWGLRFWDLAFVRHGRYQPPEGKDAQWIRGAYLTQSLGHCGACHTPRGPAFEERGYDESSDLYLTGGVNDHWFAPNLTGDPGSGLGRLSESNIVRFLKTGHGDPLHVVGFGSMVPVIENSTQHFTQDDLQAIAHYLKSLPAHRPSGAYAPARAADPAPEAGQAVHPGAGLYMSFCVKCHVADGGGKPDKFPALAGNPVVLSADVTSLIRVVLQGGPSPATREGPKSRKMPAFADKLNDTEIARVLSFVRDAWGNQARPVTTRQVSSLRERLRP